MKKFIIKTLGCKTNQVESETIAEILKNNGYFEVQNIIGADYFILNSCSVTHTADIKNISYLRRAKRENPKIKTVLTGCMAQLEKENIIKENIADFVIGNYEKNDIVKIIEANEKCCVSDIFSHDNFRYDELHQTQKTRAFIKIQDGCNNRCSYCVIPFARGKNRSDSVENIIKKINVYADEGYYETVLTGIHIGQWGMDFEKSKTLMSLLEQIENTKITRYRLGSLNPTELTNDFIDFLAQSKKFCPHFHLSLQSCCDNTLKAMNRNYSAERIKELVEYINEKFENAFIGSDIIAGFAGETEVDFETTKKNLENLKLTRMHIFPYSRRRGTIADKLPNQVSEHIKKERCKILQEISDKKLHDFLESNIGTEHKIIVEKKRDRKTNLLKGVTENYINVLVDSAACIQDTLQKVLISGFSEHHEKMLAKII